MKRVALIAGGLVAFVVLLAAMLALFGQDVPATLAGIWEGAFGDKYGIGRTAARATPLILCGVGLAIAWRAGMYNIGGEGQYVLGGLGAATVFAFAPDLPPLIFAPLCLIAGVISGGAYAWIAGWLQVARGVQVVISTILLNFVAIKLLEWAVAGPLQESKGQLPQTERIPRELELWRLDRQTDLHLGILIALIAAGGFLWWLYRTRSGFETRVVGESATAARANRVPTPRRQMIAMGLSGGLCGLAGAITHLTVSPQIGIGFPEGWGFMAIPVALLGGLNPAGVAASGIAFGGLLAGTEQVGGFSDIGRPLAYLVQGLAVLAFVAWPKGKRDA